MKTRYYILSLAAVALLASCAKEMPAPVDNPGEDLIKTYLTVGIDQETKTQLGDDGSKTHKVYWSNGDKIAVNGTASDALDGLSGTEQKTTFSFSGTLSTPYNVVYPASIYTDATHVTLPAVQTYDADSFADGMFPMAGYSVDGSSITLKHLCAVLKVSVKRATSGTIDEDNIVAVRFKGLNNEKVNGSFEINYETPALTPASSFGSEVEVRVVKNQATSATAIDYYLVVPAREYGHGFEVIVQDASGHIMTKTAAASGKTLVAGKLYTLPEFEFKPTDTEVGVVIANASDLINFATAFNNKEYGEDVVATVIDDITFDATTSADFNATNGIGQKKNVNGATEDNYFSGVFNGDGHVISGLDATVPIFAYTQSGSLIEDLILDNTCTFTVNSPAADPNHGVLVGRNKGNVMNVNSEASVTINNIQDINTVAQHYGGLVGRNYGGTIEGCIVSGNITCSQTGQTITAGTDLCAYVGGIAGTQADKGTINNSSFTGNIAIHDGTTYGDISAAGTYFYVAGIVGYAENGVISECTTGIDGTATSIDIRGTFVPAIGGIAGWTKTATNSEIRDCNNYAALSFASNGARAETTPQRIGGIASRSAADIKDCNNSGAISSVSNSTTVYLGGIVGDGANVSNCINKAGGTLTRTNAEATATQTNRYIYMGGIMGGTNAACDVTGCKNYAAVTSNAIGTATQTTADMGGIVGCGGASSALQIDILSCENNGAVTLTNNGTVVTTRLAIGGILGYGPAANSTIKSCDNKAQIYCNSQQNKAGRASYSGGIAGLMGSFGAGVDDLEIASCTNSARVWNRNYNNTVDPASSTPFGGGIVGAIIGTSTSMAYIHDCSTSGGDVVELRGYSGGIAGYTEQAVIENNTVAQALTGSNANSQGMGGIVGWAVSTLIDSCSNSGDINAAKDIGGLVAKLDTGSSIINCEVNDVTLTKGTHAAATAAAVLVSEAANGTTITNCGVKGTIDGAAITLSSNMITTDGGATVTGT
ncbi:MAG: hypothetical protein J6W09_08135, partial [Bacteroidales bacterium]|nr:hypothetical protein [Bacteroidales bacterium]